MRSAAPNERVNQVYVGKLSLLKAILFLDIPFFYDSLPPIVKCYIDFWKNHNEIYMGIYFCHV